MARSGRRLARVIAGRPCLVRTIPASRGLLAVTPFTTDNDMSAESHISLDRVGIDFTIYHASARLLKKTLLRTAVGGFIRTPNERGHVVVRALQDITLDIRSGDRVALLGHNGAGKTTLLRALAGIYSRIPLLAIGLGLDDEASGYENILLRGLLIGLSRSEIERSVDDIAAFSGLGDFLDLPMRTYSSGMIMRLMFSIATSVEAEILLMDEWFGTGDQEFVVKANERVRKLIDRARILIFASHNLGLVEKLCNRGVVLEGGRVIFDGSIKEAIALYSKQQPA
jgi:lipopolysaccharide transport system ATP-binding protein